MSYTKHAWVTGETITAEKLNNIEDGIDGIDGGKQNAPVTAGTAGQVLSLDNQLNPVWVDQTITDYVASIGALGTVTLGTTWTGSDPYTSTVTVTGCTVTEKTLVNILPDPAVVEQMQDDGIAEIYITNNGGALTATAVGGVPTQAITLNVLCTESDFAADIDELSRHLSDKQDKPAIAGTAGQVLGLNNSLQPVWVNQSGGGGDVSNCAPIIINTASGDIATFADGADNRQIRKIVGTIVPVQDLHGYDAPWPAGGGKNKLNVSLDVVKPLNTSGQWNGNTYTQNGGTFVIGDDGSITVNGTFTNTTYLYLGDFAVGDNAVKINGYQEPYTSMLSLTAIAGSTWYTVSSDDGREIPASTTVSVRIYVATNATASNAVFKPMIRLSSVTDATFAPYSNECPISGWTGANIEQRGKNLYPYGTIQAYTYEWYSGSKALADATNPVLIFGGKAYVLSWVNSDADAKPLVRVWRKNGEPLENEPTVLNMNMTNLSGLLFSYNATAKFYSFPAASSVNAAIILPTEDLWLDMRVQSGKAISTNTQLEIGQVKTDYAAYNPATIPINWQTEAGTVYGGTVTLNEDGSADVIGTCEIYTVNRNNVLVASYSYTNVKYAEFRKPANSALNGINNDTKICVCSIGTIYRRAGGFDNSARINQLVISATGEYFWFGFAPETTLEEMQETLDGTVICHELKPKYYQTYHFDNVGELFTYLGTNNVWIDTGAITECDYPVDTKTYVDENGGGSVNDVQIAGTSILRDGVANIPNANGASSGVVWFGGNMGVGVQGGQVRLNPADSAMIKAGINDLRTFTVNKQHEAAFYGLAKAAGDTTQSASSNPVGTYTEDAKSAIHEMLNGAVTVSGTTPSITAKSGITYVCGEVATLDITIPASGIFEVQFVSGSTPTVLTATGVTWVNGFDPTALEANKTYDISVSNGIGVAVWI